MESNFLDDFKYFVFHLPKDEVGNFVGRIDNQLQQPSECFLNQLCRKIDIKKILYIDYDAQKDLMPISSQVISNNTWLKVIYILSYFTFQGISISIRYKALNTLLKTKEIVPEECLKNDFVVRIYNNLEEKL